MPTYLAWDREVLEECYDQVDGLSLHAYYGNTARWSNLNSSARYLAMNLDMDRHIHESGRGMRLRPGPAALAEAAVAVVRRMERLVPRARRAGEATARGTAAPRLLEEVYNLDCFVENIWAAPRSRG